MWVYMTDPSHILLQNSFIHLTEYKAVTVIMKRTKFGTVKLNSFCFQQHSFSACSLMIPQYIIEVGENCVLNHSLSLSHTHTIMYRLHALVSTITLFHPGWWVHVRECKVKRAKTLMDFRANLLHCLFRRFRNQSGSSHVFKKTSFQ